MISKKPTLIIHGGAGNAIASARALLLRKKLKVILKKVYRILLSKGAVEAVVTSVKLMEDDPSFNAGRGSLLQRDGRARLSASVMDGSRHLFAGVLNLEKVLNPVLVAQQLLNEKDRVLCGKEAFNYAKQHGFNLGNLKTLESIQRWKKQQTGCDTVGACALDSQGNLASATSTGGRGFERPGRVSDSGMPIGNFSTKFCAVSATGVGEEIMAEGVAVKIVTRMEDGLSIKRAFEKTFGDLKTRNRQIGAIGLDYKGNWLAHTTTESLIYGVSERDKILLF